MAESNQIVLLDSPEAAARAIDLFPGSICAYANGELPPEAEGKSDGIAISADANWRQRLCAKFAANRFKKIRQIDGTIDHLKSHAEALEWARANLKPYENSAPQDVDLPSTVDSSPATPADAEPLPNPSPPPADGNLPAPADPQAVGAGPSEDAPERAQDDAPPAWMDEIPDDLDDVQRDVRQASALKRQAFENIDPEPWQEPLDLWNSRPLPRFNPDWVLPCLRAVSSNNAAIVGCDQGIDYLQRIAFAAGCLSDEIKIRVRPSQDWLESARIWACIVGDSGDGKSPSMLGIKGPSQDLRFEIAERCKEKFATYKANHDVYELDRKEWVQKKHKGEPVGKLPLPPEKPVNELLYFSGTTAEGLLEQQEQSTRGTMLEADEVLGWALGMDQYKAGGKGSDKAFWLSSWNGSEFVGILVGKLRTIHNTGVTIIGGTQPHAIRLAMAKENFTTDDGLVQRFLFHVSNGLADEDNNQPTDRDALARWKNIIHRLYYMKPHLQPCEFTPAAHRVRQRMNDWLNNLRSIYTIPEAERQALTKWRSYFPRLCLTLHAIESADAGCEVIPQMVDDHIAESVYKYMVECLWPSLDHFYGEAIDNSDDMRTVRTFAEYVLARDIKTVITVNFGRNFNYYRKLKSLSLRREFWNQICMAGWARPLGIISRNEGISSRYEINPLAFDGRFSERAEKAKVVAQAHRDAAPAEFLAKQGRH